MLSVSTVDHDLVQNTDYICWCIAMFFSLLVSPEFFLPFDGFASRERAVSTRSKNSNYDSLNKLEYYSYKKAK